MDGGGFRHGLGDRAHAADRVSPHALLAVHLAEAMVQQDIGRAGRVGARISADNAVKAEDGLDRRAFEPAVQIEKIALQVEPKRANSVADSTGLDQLANRG